MVIFAIERRLSPTEFKERIAHDVNTQLRYLLNGGLKVHISAAFLSSGQKGY